MPYIVCQNKKFLKVIFCRYIIFLKEKPDKIKINIGKPSEDYLTANNKYGC